MKRRFLALLLSASAVLAQTPDLEGLTTASQADLRRTLDDLAALRTRIEAEKVPLVQSINQLEQQTLDLRAELQKRERFQENQLVELNQMKAQVRARGEEVKYLDALLAEYLRAFRTRTHVAEAARWQPLWQRIEAAAVAPDLSAAERLTRQAELLRASVGRLQAVAGGERFEAKVLGPTGRLESGHVALFGPLAFFAAEGQGAAGLVQQELNQADPSVYVLPSGVGEGVRQLAATGTGDLGLDPTLGNAIKLASVEETFVEHFLKGGVVMWPMALLAFAAIVVALIKWVQLSRFRTASPEDLQTVVTRLRSGDPSAALAHARSVPGPAGDLLVTAVEHADEKKEYLEEVLYEKMLNTKPRLESLIPFLALTAAAAPLLGLLGTVTGMIATFQMISIFGTGDPRTLSSGISEALITTEYGLYVAIPAVLVHAFLNRKAKGLLGSMEQTAVGFINGLPEPEEATA